MNKTQAKRKFEIGDTVIMKKKNIWGETQGEIIEFERSFKEVDANGNFDPDGLVTLERTIESTCLPYRFDGETYQVDYPERNYGGFTEHAHTSISKFYGYSYTIKTEKGNSIYQESGLRKVK